MENWRKTLKAAHRRADLADRAAFKVLEGVMVPGRMVKWKHGKHLRMGEVVGILGFQFHHAGVRVKSIISGKLIDVHASAIIAQL